MYMMPGMLEMGLKEGQTWPSERHKKLAEAICLCNRNIRTRDALNEAVQWCVERPAEFITDTLTLGQIVDAGFPFIM